MKRFLATVAGLALLAPTLASAQFTTDLTSQGDMQITDISHSPAGTFSMQLLGNPGQPTIDSWCIDFVNNIQENTLYTANFTSFEADPTDFDNRTRFNSVALDSYKRAAWLVQDRLRAAVAANDVNAVFSIHCAIWDLFAVTTQCATQGWTGTAAYIAAMSDAATASAANFYGMGFRYWYVVSDPALEGPPAVDRGGFQELITYQTPEPASMVLMATGLIALGAHSLRNRRKKGNH